MSEQPKHPTCPFCGARMDATPFPMMTCRGENPCFENLKQSAVKKLDERINHPTCDTCEYYYLLFTEDNPKAKGRNCLGEMRGCPEILNYCSAHPALKKR